MKAARSLFGNPAVMTLRRSILIRWVDRSRWISASTTGFEAVDYGTEEHPYEIQYGTAYQTIPNSFDVLGFDDQYIRFAVAAVRTSNKPMARLFGKEDPYDVTLTEAVQVESRVKRSAFLPRCGRP